MSLTSFPLLFQKRNFKKGPKFRRKGSTVSRAKMYQFDLAAEQLSTDLMLSPSSNSPIQMQLETSLETRRGISCAVPLPPPHSWHKRQGKSERDSEQEGEERQRAGIAGCSPGNVPQELHNSEETIYRLSPRLGHRVGSVME